MERLSDAELVQQLQEYETLVSLPAWKRLEEFAREKKEAIKEALCKVVPTDAPQIASLQAQARECDYLFQFVAERIYKGREAQKRLAKKEG